jgi:hypothetical protein
VRGAGGGGVTTIDRRTLLKSAAGAAALVALGQRAGHGALAGDWTIGDGPYGPLRPPNADGLMLPEGFTSRIVATGEQLVPGTTYPWHRFPDGGAAFPAPGGSGGWLYVSNSEMPLLGGASAIAFAADGAVTGAHRILIGTNLNCAGGPTPWGTWLSCEEHPFGLVWECDPTRPGQGVPRLALGVFSHEAVAVDHDRGQLYLTEDDGSDGRDGFYRFTPDAYPDLTSGSLEVASLDAASGRVTWLEIDPHLPARLQRPAAQTTFDGAEGCWYADGHVWFTTKSDNRVYDLDAATDTLTVLYEAGAVGPLAPLTGVDNLTRTPAGDLVVAEDGGNMELVLLTADGVVAPLVRVVGHDGSEVTGPAFAPSGTRLYFSSQRGGPNQAGVTFEVAGPFHR